MRALRHSFCTMSQNVLPQKWLPKSLADWNWQPSPDSFGLSMGAPGPHLAKKCALLLKEATAKRMDVEIASGCQGLSYGAPMGDHRYLRSLASFLSQHYGDEILPDNLLATCGASSGLQYLLTMIFPHKCPVFCEELTYHIGVGVMQDAFKFPVTSVSFDGEGIVPDSLEEQATRNVGIEPVIKSIDNLQFSSVLYLVPTFHNPTGRCISPDRARAVIKIARKYKMLVICDDVYNMLCYSSEKPPQRLLAYDREMLEGYTGNVVSNGSFSKILCPALRLGWLEGPDWLWQFWSNSKAIGSGGGISQFSCSIVATALENGAVTRLLQEAKSVYASNMKLVVTILQEKLNFCKIETPMGGYFIWLTLPDYMDAQELLVKAKEQYSLYFIPGIRFCASESDTVKYKNCLRLSISYEPLDRMTIAADNLCKLIIANKN